MEMCLRKNWHCISPQQRGSLEVVGTLCVLGQFAWCFDPGLHDPPMRAPFFATLKTLPCKWRRLLESMLKVSFRQKHRFAGHWDVKLLHESCVRHKTAKSRKTTFWKGQNAKSPLKCLHCTALGSGSPKRALQQSFDGVTLIMQLYRFGNISGKHPRKVVKWKTGKIWRKSLLEIQTRREAKKLSNVRKSWGITPVSRQQCHS